MSNRWTNRITGYGEESPEQLLAHHANPRRHDRHQQEVMESLLREIGVIQDVIVNERTGNLIDGHMRVMLALRTGQETIPVKYVDLDPDAELAAVATLDAITGLAETDAAAFETLLDSVTTGEAPLQAFLAKLHEKGGSVPDDKAAGDDLTPSRPLGRMVWGSHSTVMSRDEQDAFTARVNAYEAEHGALAGFVADLLNGKEIP